MELTTKAPPFPNRQGDFDLDEGKPDIRPSTLLEMSHKLLQDRDRDWLV